MKFYLIILLFFLLNKILIIFIFIKGLFKVVLNLVEISINLGLNCKSKLKLNKFRLKGYKVILNLI